MQFAKKSSSFPHVNSTTNSVGGIILPSAAASNFSRVGVPLTSGYINLHSSGIRPNMSKNIEYIIDLNAGDEVALFTTGIGVYGPIQPYWTVQYNTVPTETFAVTEYCSFSIQSM